MNRLLTALALPAVLLVLATAPRAQGPGEAETPLFLAGAEGLPAYPMRFAAGAVYQRYDDDGTDLTLITVPFTTFFDLAQDLSLSVRAAFASADGTDMASYFGFADAQAAMSYLRPLGAGSAVAGLAVNLPTGVAGATPAEAETAFLLGQGFYDFRLPSLGQGFNIAPSLTYAFPMGERLALGLGASYQFRGPFQPRRFSDDTYDPGDELLLTAGLDYRLAEASTLALDLSYVRYGEDEWEGLAYRTGDAFAATAQWNAALGAHEGRVLGRVRLKGESDFPEETLALFAPDAAIPSLGRLLGHVRFRFGPHLRLGALAQGRYYDASEVFEERVLFDAGVLPEYEVAPGLWLTGRLGATLGDFKGIEAGAGLSWGL
jgi:hypothetical protein